MTLSQHDHVLVIFSLQVCSTGVFELNLHGFYNDLGLNANGHCCSGIREHGSCSLSCRTFFRVCLSHYQAAIEEDPMHCTIGDLTTPVIGENSVNFSRMDMPISNPLQFSIAQFTWPVRELCMYKYMIVAFCHAKLEYSLVREFYYCITFNV